jgi:hypothetical protein
MFFHNHKLSLLFFAEHHVEMGYAKVIGGFYQVAHESEPNMVSLLAHYSDSTGQIKRPSKLPRARIVLCVEFQAGLLFHSSVPPLPPVITTANVGGGGGGGGASSSVTTVDGIPVYEWWFGDRGEGLSTSSQAIKPRGMWRSYHPTVCARIEAALQAPNSRFREALDAVDVDGARYMIKRLTSDAPYHATQLNQQGLKDSGAAAEELLSLKSPSATSTTTTQENLLVTIKHPSFEDIDVKTNNCFIQYHKNNPMRWRVARRRTSPEEIARNALKTGEPCSICYSDEGELTGGDCVWCDGGSLFDIVSCSYSPLLHINHIYIYMFNAPC